MEDQKFYEAVEEKEEGTANPMYGGVADGNDEMTDNPMYGRSGEFETSDNQKLVKETDTHSTSLTSQSTVPQDDNMVDNPMYGSGGKNGDMGKQD